jgi:hypothetical protein
MTSAREAFLNLIADARRFDEQVDGDEVNGRAVVYISYVIETGHEQLKDLAEALGIKLRFAETAGDAIKRALDLPPPPASGTQEVGK